MKITKTKASGIILIMAAMAGVAFFAPFFSYSPASLTPAETVFAKEAAKAFTGNAAVLQNLTTDKISLITVLRKLSEPQSYPLFHADGTSFDGKVILTSTNIDEVYAIDRLDIQDLKPNQDYILKILDKNQKWIDSRQFRSLDLEKENPTIAIASCARVGWLGHDFGPRSIWDELQDQKPDVLLFLGDMVYPDTTIQALLAIKPNQKEIVDHYIEAWQVNRGYHQFNLFPVFSVMDDHDYGFQGANSKNNGEKKEAMVKFFRTFYPVPEAAIENVYSPGIGAGFEITAFGFKIIMLDNKFERVAAYADEVDGPVWGQKQLEWMGQVLAKNDKPALIGSGTLYTFPVKNLDAAQYEAPAEFQNFLAQARKNPSPVILLSGDVHYSAVHKLPKEMLGYITYEIIASRIHSIAPAIIPPFINGYLGPAFGQLIHTDEKNFVLLKPKTKGRFQDADASIFIKNTKQPLQTTLTFQ